MQYTKIGKGRNIDLSLEFGSETTREMEMIGKFQLLCQFHPISLENSKDRSMSIESLT
jgi:hypothetical protein